jgi:hypothetical protein
MMRHDSSPDMCRAEALVKLGQGLLYPIRNMPITKEVDKPSVTS